MLLFSARCDFDEVTYARSTPLSTDAAFARWPIGKRYIVDNTLGPCRAEKDPRGEQYARARGKSAKSRSCHPSRDAGHLWMNGRRVSPRFFFFFHSLWKKGATRCSSCFFPPSLSLRRLNEKKIYGSEGRERCFRSIQGKTGRTDRQRERVAFRVSG